MSRFTPICDDVYLWSDSCNVYIIKDGPAALLIDLGDGSVLDHLSDLGIRRVEWVLFTHHHREQCQGIAKLNSWNAKIAVPEAERTFFETPREFRRQKPTLSDPFSVYGSSFVRPPVQPIAVDRTFQKMDDFTWRGREFVCIDTRGNSPGSMSYLWRRNGEWLAFSGDVMLDGAKFHNWFDSEWDYGFAKGLYALFASASLLEDYRPTMLLPSHGPVIREPLPQLASYQRKLRELETHYLRGYELFRFAAAAQDRVSRPTDVPHVWRVTPHLFKFKGPDFWPNFTMLLADDGHALVIDCGLFSHEFLDKSLLSMRERLGLKAIDAVIVTHMHGDHMQECPFLRERWNAEIWTMDKVVAPSTHPERFDYAAAINTYGKPFDHVTFDRVLRDGETFHWNGYSLTVDWMPGQTEFALCLHGEIDGRRVAFTGDNIFASTTDPTQTGHEAVVAHNSGILEEGYLYAANYLHSLSPDLIIGGHSWVMDQPRELIERYRASVLALRDALRSLSPDSDYRYRFDPFWIRAYPYRVTLPPGGEATATLLIRNFRSRPQTHRVVVHTPPGISVEPAIFDGETHPESTSKWTFRVRADKSTQLGTQFIAFDATVDGHRYGEWFDVIVQVGDTTSPRTSSPAATKGNPY